MKIFKPSKIGSRSIAVAVCFFSFSLCSAYGLEIREIDGLDNNPLNPALGSAGSSLIRILPADYKDGASEPRGGQINSTLPNPRVISNLLSAQPNATPALSRISSWFWQWGQFIDHDLDLTGHASPIEPFNIDVPTGDIYLDPTSAGNREIPLSRSIFTIDGSATRQQINEISAFIDGSNVYGSDSLRAADLRVFDGLGKLRTSSAYNGEIILPFNSGGLDNAMPAGSDPGDFFIAGDVRANEQIGLTATHTLFMREHNRLATELKTRLDSADPLLVSMRDSAIGTPHNGINSEGDFIYQAARKVVAAQIQKITYEEFIPILLGPGALPAYNGYDQTIDPGISNAFSTAAFRVGHSMLPDQLLRSHNLNISTATNIALRDAFFNPQEIVDHGVDTLLLGLLLQPAQEVDTLIVDGVRNFLFSPPDPTGIDLAALNIQRGRDHGLPGYNDYREYYGLGKATDFTDITGGDPVLAALFEALYNDIDDVDLWIGGLAEPHAFGGVVGETFWHILADQFTRLRDGDRFAFLNQEEMNELLQLDPGFDDYTSLTYLVNRNTHYSGMPSNMFLLPARAPAPATLLLILIGAFGFLLGRKQILLL